MTNAASRLGTIELRSFRLERVLGEGFFGVAYLAEQLGTERLAVVKIAHPEVVSGPHGELVRARYAAEVKAATRIHHPRLCTVYTFGETTDGLPAIAMEYIEGETMRVRLQRLAGQPMGSRELVELFSQLVDVLKAVHGYGVVHRDITPNNVMLSMDHDGRSQLKLVDFGIAKLSDRSSSDFIAGTPGYAAPEQLSGSASTASDIFSVGALLWWAATGYELLEELQDPDQVMAAIAQWEVAPDPRAVCPTVPTALARLVRDLLDPTPEFRPTLDGVLEALESLDESGAARPRRVLLVDPTRYLYGSLSNLLVPVGIQLAVAPDARRATHHDGEFGAILLAARQTASDVAALYQHLTEFVPGTPVLVVASGPEPVAWEAVPFNARVRLPGGASRIAELGDALKAGRAAVRSGAQTAVQGSVSLTGWARESSKPHATSLRAPAPSAPTPGRGTQAYASGVSVVPATSARSAPPRDAPTAQWAAYTGGMPELLIELDAEISNRGDFNDVCRRVESLASSVGAREVFTLTQTLRLLSAEGDIENPAVFLANIEAAYVRSVRERSRPAAPPSTLPSAPARIWSRQ